MREREEDKRLELSIKAVSFFFWTFNEDAEFFIRETFGSRQVLGFGKRGRVTSFSVCSLPTYCSSDRVWQREKFFREETMFFSRVNNGWKHESGLDTNCQVSGHVTPSNTHTSWFALISITVTYKRFKLYHIFMKSPHYQLAVTYLGGEPQVYLVKWLMCWQHFSLKKAKIIAKIEFLPICTFSCFMLHQGFNRRHVICLHSIPWKKTSFCSILPLLRFWEILTIFPPRP